MNNKKITIAIVDDHTLFRRGLVNLMKEFQEIEVVFEAENGIDFQDKVKKYGQIAVVLMDITMPMMDGYATTAWIKSNYPSTKVLAISMFEDKQVIIKMLKSGAGGYLLKASKPSDVLHAIQVINQKEVYLNELVSGTLLSSLKKDPHKITLTEKEQIFLQLCCSDLTYDQIAEQMNISPRTIGNYREPLFRKMNVKSRHGLMLYGIKNGLVSI